MQVAVLKERTEVDYETVSSAEPYANNAIL